MRGNAHVRFGGRAEETDVPKDTHCASARPDHTHAALLIAQGEHPKVIQARLGHASIKTTLDTYGHLFDGLDEAAADRLDQTWRASRVDSLWTRVASNVVDFPAR